MSLPNRFKMLRELADGLLKIAYMDVPFLDLEIEEELGDMGPGERHWQTWDQDVEWVQACNDILDVLSNMEGRVSYDKEISQEKVEPGTDAYWYVDLKNRTEFTEFWGTITSWGDKILIAEYDTLNGSRVLWEGMVEGAPPSIPEVMLTVASEELAYLTNLSGSCKKALDYWQIEGSPKNMTQKDWSDIRGVGRQTVNDSIRAIRNEIDAAQEEKDDRSE